MEREADVEKLVTYIVASLVDDPESVTIERRDEGKHVTFEVTVEENDTGKVIGRQGRVIKAIRTLARAAGSIDGSQVDVEVIG